MRSSMLAMILALVLVGCASSGNVNVLQGNSAITPGATVAWAPVAADERQNGDPRIDNDIIRQRVRAAVESAVAARGHTFVEDPSAARYLITYHIGLQDRQDYRVDSPGLGAGVCGWRGCVSGFGWGIYGAPTDVRAVSYNEGTMMLDIKDRSTGQLAWRATSQQRVDAADATQERLNTEVAAMVRSLP